ncbi:MAG: radical SAM protein, partial [Actinobacteria bacterium ATB1]|nr:radical SAM protein [Actinobacteria bacterium ATB1]
NVVTANLEVANTCNSLCETCPLTFGIHEHAAFLSFSEVEGITAQLPDLRRAVVHGIGEPFLNPELPRMVHHLAVRGVTTCFNTNGLLLNRRCVGDLIEAGLDDLRISLDAAQPETYRRI